MATVQVLQKKRPSASMNSSHASRTNLFPSRTSQDQHSGKVRSSSLSRIKQSDNRLETHGRVVRQKLPAQKVSAATCVGNLTTSYRQEQEAVKVLQKKIMVENRAYKEAQRNSKAASQDLSNAIAESNDRRVRLDEVIEVFQDCKTRASRVESDQRLLRDMMSKAKYDVECSYEIVNRLNSKKQDNMLSIIKYLNQIGEQNEAMEKQAKDNELSFKHQQMQHQSEIDLKNQRLDDLNQSMASLKQQNIQLGITSSEDAAEVEALELQFSAVQELNATHKAKIQSVKSEIEAEKIISQEQLGTLQKEIKCAVGLYTTSVTAVAKITVEENRLIKQQTLLAEENKSKETKMKNSNCEFESKLRSLKVKIDNLESNHAGLEEKIMTVNDSINGSKEEVKNLLGGIEACDQDIASATLQADSMQEKIRTLLDQATKDEASFQTQEDAFRMNSEKSIEQVKSLKLEIDDLEKSELRLELKEKELEDNTANLLLKSSEIEKQIKLVENEQELYKSETASKASTLAATEAEWKATVQASKAALISLHIEEKEIDTKIDSINAQTLKVKSKLQILSETDLVSLPLELRNELLPLSEIEAIKAEVLKRQEFPSQQHGDTDIDVLIAEEKHRYQLFNERKETIRVNAKAKLESDLLKIDKKMIDDQKAIDDLKTLDEDKEESESEFNEPDAKSVKLKAGIEEMLKHIESNELEIDNLMADIEQITEFAALSAKKKKDKDKEKKDDEEKAKAKEAQNLAIANANAHKSKTRLESVPSRDESLLEDSFDEDDEEVVPVFQRSRKAKLKKTSQSEAVNYGDDEAEKQTTTAPKKLSTKRKKKQVVHRPVATNRLHDTMNTEFECSFEGEEEAESDLFSNEVCFSQPKQKAIKKNALKHVAAENCAPKSQNQNQLKSRQKNSAKATSQLKSSHGSREVKVTGPHVIAGEDGEDEDISFKQVKHVSSFAKKPLPALVPLDEKYTASPHAKSKHQNRHKSDKRGGTSARGVSRSRSPSKKTPSTSSQKHGQKPRNNKKSKVVTQEADWLFSSQDGFSF